MKSASDASKYAGLADENKAGHSHVLQKVSTQEETRKGIRAACVPDLSDKLKYVQLLQRLWQVRIRGLHGIIEWGSRQRGSCVVNLSRKYKLESKTQ